MALRNTAGRKTTFECHHNLESIVPGSVVINIKSNTKKETKKKEKKETQKRQKKVNYKNLFKEGRERGRLGETVTI